MAQENTTSPPTKKLLNQVREKIRFKHYSLSTEKTYISWIKHYLVFNGKRHPADMSAIEVERFLTYLDTLKEGINSLLQQCLLEIIEINRLFPLR